MKNLLVLHGTNGTSQHNWFPWLKKTMEQKGWQVWVPDLPGAETPNAKRYTEFLLGNKDWKFSPESVVIGHSSGAVALLHLLQQLPDDVVIDTAILVSAFKDDLGWESLQGLFETAFNFKKIKKQAKKFIFIHSDNDPYCPLDHATYLSEQLGGELIIESGELHFSTEAGGEKYREFPLLLSILY